MVLKCCWSDYMTFYFEFHAFIHKFLIISHLIITHILWVAFQIPAISWLRLTMIIIHASAWPRHILFMHIGALSFNASNVYEAVIFFTTSLPYSRIFTGRYFPCSQRFEADFARESPYDTCQSYFLNASLILVYSAPPPQTIIRISIHYYVSDRHFIAVTAQAYTRKLHYCSYCLFHYADLLLLLPSHAGFYASHNEVTIFLYFSIYYSRYTTTPGQHYSHYLILLSLSNSNISHRCFCPPGLITSFHA